METDKWQLVARDGAGLSVTLVRRPSIVEIETEHARLAPLLPGFGPWHARCGDVVLDLPRPRGPSDRR